MPDIFDDMDVFAEWFDFSDNLKEKEGDGKQLLEDESSSSVIHNLHNILKPFLLRRVKTEVEIDIPKKKELLVHCPMMPKQRELYEAALSGIGGLRQALSSSSGHKGEEQPQAHDDENSGASANGVVKRVSKHQSYQDISDLEFDDLIENGIDGSVGQVSIYERKKKGNTGAAVNNVDDGKTRELGDLKRSRRSIFSPVFVLLFSYSEKGG